MTVHLVQAYRCTDGSVHENRTDAIAWEKSQQEIKVNGELQRLIIDLLKQANIVLGQDDLLTLIAEFQKAKGCMSKILQSWDIK